MKRSLLVFALVLGLLLSCSEKCPLEPYSEACDDLYGALYPPEGARLPVRDLQVRTPSGLCGLNRDLSFCLPGLPGSGAGVIAATIHDTVPVMLGYVLPEHITTETGEDVPVTLGEDLRCMVRDPSGAVRISGASTALGLIMLSPFLGGATVQERARFASLAARHAAFGELAADVCTALVSSPEELFDRAINPGLYEQATLILSNLIDLEKRRLAYPPPAGPYVLDGRGDFIDLINPTSVHYGVRVAPEGEVTADTVFLVRGRDIVAPVGTGPVTVSEYLLGSGRFDIEFYKGFAGFSTARRLDPEHAGGLATLANAEQTLWYALTIPVGCPALEDPGSMGIGDADWVEALAEAIEAEDTGKVLDLAVEYLCVNPDDFAGWLGVGVLDLVDAQHYLAAVRGILAANTAYLEAANLAPRLPFYSDLHAAAHHESLLVCQRDGAIVPCENAPVLTEGTVAPLFGHTDTVFTYSVHYYDHEGQAPSDKHVVIDGRSFAMELADGVPADGTYRYRTTLEAGLHTFHFECTDTHGDTTRLPATGSFTGPTVRQPGGRNPDMKVAVHVRPHNPKAGCDYGTIEACWEIETTAEGFCVNAFPVFFDLTEYQMVEYGLSWPAWVYSAVWYDCCDATIGEIRWPGDGVVQTWGECRSEWAAVPGYVWLYADGPGYVCVYPHPASGRICVYDCSGGVDGPMVWICAGVYGALGDAPCSPMSHQPSAGAAATRRPKPPSE